MRTVDYYGACCARLAGAALAPRPRRRQPLARQVALHEQSQRGAGGGPRLLHVDTVGFALACWIQTPSAERMFAETDELLIKTFVHFEPMVLEVWPGLADRARAANVTPTGWLDLAWEHAAEDLRCAEWRARGTAAVERRAAQDQFVAMWRAIVEDRRVASRPQGWAAPAPAAPPSRSAPATTGSATAGPGSRTAKSSST